MNKNNKLFIILELSVEFKENKLELYFSFKNVRSYLGLRIRVFY